MVIKTRVFKVKSLVNSEYTWVVQTETSAYGAFFESWHSRRLARNRAKEIRNANR